MFHIRDPPTSSPSQYNEHPMICYTRQHEGMGASYRPFGFDRSSSLGRNELMKHVLVFLARRPLVRLGPIFRYIKTIPEGAFGRFQGTPPFAAFCLVLKTSVASNLDVTYINVLDVDVTIQSRIPKEVLGRCLGTFAMSTPHHRFTTW